MTEIESAFNEIFQDSLNSSFRPDFSLIKQQERSVCLIDSDSEVFYKACHLAGISKDWIPGLHSAVMMIKNNRKLFTVYRYAVELLLNNIEQYDARLFRNWPDPVIQMKDSAPLFYLLLSLETVPIIRAVHLKMGISDRISRDSCTGIGSKAEDYYFLNEHPGMMKKSIYWFQNLIQGRLFRCGRLEFMLKEIEPDLFGYRNPMDNEFRILLKSPTTEKWISPSVDGKTEIEADKSSFKKWNCVLKPGDKVLDMHIPGGGGLTLHLVRDSFQMALDFFEELYPEMEIKGFQCCSWIFSPDLEKIYPEGANLLLLKQAVHLYPVRSMDVEGIGFILGTSSWDTDQCPQKTSIQRNLKRHLLKGGCFRIAAMVLLKEEIENLEKQKS
ncbi:MULTISPECIES: acyltransferase domain-containing protein [unclassified Oceanispirochaeta]|uniref:acyltransferase domain-containing protein n=1 Tax=unclassified Oceanispirochaeta TaxID=2635722 RepID=UPI000E096F52|nr:MULTISPECIES: acyltransferase domain-containing protein [unclassified Oceanispirochaeta]MBF9017715.1 hypothetical protein [Oceanispirochaeta sp. M2]NPD72118.1 hypothetical protein [Oceanispirochaeta sp. M1]RDG32560.1 hypothetical protein DV872_08390 [Oceanispirochaeta sp. M1]